MFTLFLGKEICLNSFRVENAGEHSAPVAFSCCCSSATRLWLDRNSGIYNLLEVSDTICHSWMRIILSSYTPISQSATIFIPMLPNIIFLAALSDAFAMLIIIVHLFHQERITKCACVFICSWLVASTTAASAVAYGAQHLCR